ncbi:hypothetical protein FGO68_gene17061 [Halteria grandinella]|uniref:Tetratricopeptide repeat protein n=1 Tax=Halteria grandinella TaxID=5974 RepID=A0A8J8SWJ1_HALGN|nr:hypothetical protein FGO68_gene17061 [Halteria grandinella]
MPKSKKIDKKKDTVYIDVEDKDPVWLKDKGDHFYKRNDYHSALNAYSKALEFDKEFLMGRLNRATTWLRVRCFENAVEDLNDIETFIMNLKEDERDNDDFYQRMLARTFLRRGAGYAWLSKFDLAVENLTEAQKYKNVFNERELIEISNDVDRIKVRQKSLSLKTDGDLQFANSNLDEAAELYRECLEIDPLNEYVLANMGLIYLMKQDHAQCIEYSTKSLEILNGFLDDTKSFQKDHRLEVKILMRRGKSYEALGESEKAKQDLDQALLLEPQNGEAKVIQKRVQDKLDVQAFDELNKQAVEYQKQLNWAGALEYYDKCIKLQTSRSKGLTIDTIAIYVNKIACLLSLEKFDKVVSECNDTLRLIRNHRNRFEEKQTVEEKKRLLQMEIRVSVRRGNALAKLNRVSEAVQEYERALKMDPANEGIKRDLETLKKGN